jgi:signal transduction histidine kinase
MLEQSVPTSPPQGDDESPAPAGQARRSWWNWLGRIVPSIRHKIILPYLLLTAAAAATGVFIATRLMAIKIDERFTNQLLEAGRVASDGVVRQETDNLEALRPMTQTIGVAEAIEAQDIERLQELLEVQAWSANLDSILVLGGAGDLLMRLDAVRETNPEVVDRYRFSAGGNYAHLPMVAPVLAGYYDARGDKFTGLIDTPAGPILYTSAPVIRTSEDEGVTGETVGVIMVGVTLERLLIHLKNESLADIAVYMEPGVPIGSTIADWEEGLQYEELTLGPELYHLAITSPDTTPLRQIEILTLFEREYRMAYAPMVIRGQAVGVLGVLLPSSFVVRAVAVSRTPFIVVYSLAIGLVIVIGYAIAQRILRPILELATLARAVTEGDLSQRAGTFTNDELGVLAHSFNEMTARLQTTLAELEEKNARTTAILDSIADGVVVRDPEGTIILDNRAARELLTVDGRFDPAPLDDVVAEDTGLDSRITAGERTISISIAPVETEEGHTLGDVLVLRDVTRAAMAERIKDNFLNQISHELRTPLTAIRGYAEVMLHGKTRLPPELHEKAIGIIFEQTLVLSKRINELIAMTAFHSGDIVLRRRRLNLHKLVKDALADWQGDFSRASLTPHFDGGSYDIHVEADARRLRQALEAIFSNACAFSPDGGPLLVSLENRGEGVCVSVSDPGVGISEEDLPHMFERFYRGHPVDRDGRPIDVRGMGQGLHVVKSIVEAHGGTVEIESELGKGTTVRIRLPLTSDS